MVTRAQLIELAHQLGDPGARLAMAGEGNVAARTDDGRLLVTASGARLASATESSFVQVDPEPLITALSARRSDADWLATLLASRVGGGGRPTVEAALHAVIDRVCGPMVSAHTHPTSVLGLLCAGLGASFAERPLFPDQVVLLGEQMCAVPYIDPGQALARACGEAIERFIDRHSAPPRVVLMDNHGLIAIAPSTDAARDITLMAVKAAEVFLAAHCAGGVVALTESAARRIAGREDEHYRQRLLAGNDADSGNNQE